MPGTAPETSPVPTLPIYIHPPPTYPPLLGAEAAARGEANNLFSHFLDVRLTTEAPLRPQPDPKRYGQVIESVQELLRKIW